MKETETVNYYCTLFALLNETTLQLEKVIYDVPYLTDVFSSNDIKISEKKNKKLLQYEKLVKLNYLFYPTFKQDDSIMYITSMTIKQQNPSSGPPVCVSGFEYMPGLDC